MVLVDTSVWASHLRHGHEGLSALPQASIAAHDEMLAFIDARHLAGKGLGYVDVHLLAAATLTAVSP